MPSSHHFDILLLWISKVINNNKKNKLDCYVQCSFYKSKWKKKIYSDFWGQIFFKMRSCLECCIIYQSVLLSTVSWRQWPCSPLRFDHFKFTFHSRVPEFDVLSSNLQSENGWKTCFVSVVDWRCEYSKSSKEHSCTCDTTCTIEGGKYWIIHDEGIQTVTKKLYNQKNVFLKAFKG